MLHIQYIGMHFLLRQMGAQYIRQTYKRQGRKSTGGYYCY